MKLKYFVTKPLGTISAEYVTANSDSRNGKKAGRLLGFIALTALILFLTSATATPAPGLTEIDGSIVVIDDDLFVDCDGD